MNASTEIRALAIYVVKTGSRLDAVIDAGSGIVGTPVGDSERVLLHFEGNRLGASNLVALEDRIMHAAGRLFTNYPTIAKLSVAADDVATDLVEVGRLREKTEEEKALYETTTSVPGMMRLSESKRRWLAANWDVVRRPYVIEWADAEAEATARAYAGRTT